MGLDISLHHWDGTISKDEDGFDDRGGETVERDSVRHPDHSLFKIGYFRSSYNEGGINHILTDRLGYDLYKIFDVEDVDHYIVNPDWKAVLRNASRARDDLATWVGEHGALGILRAEHNMFMAVQEFKIETEQQALEEFVKMRELHPPQKPDDSGWFEGATGHWFLGQPLKVRAIIHGMNRMFEDSPWKGGRPTPCMYVVYDLDPSDFQFYVDALDIIAETAEYVLAMPDPETYELHWSG